MNEIIKTCISRWKAKTPKFFKGVQKLALTLGTSAASVWLINDVMSLELGENILSVCKYLIAIAAAMGFTSQLTQVYPQSEK